MTWLNLLAGNSWRKWPEGSYSIPMSIYGCPDQELNNWKHGSFNITLSTEYPYDLMGLHENSTIFRWKKRDLLLLGPFGEYTFQLNVCTKNKYQHLQDIEDGNDWGYVYKDGNGNEIYLDVGEWPRGEYIIFDASDRIKDIYKGRQSTERNQCPQGNICK